MSCARTRGVTPKTAWQNCIPNGQRTNGACLQWCRPRVWVHPTDGTSNFVHASHGVLHGYGRCYIPPDLKMRRIQPTSVLVRDGFAHNWTAASSNPDETGVKRMLSTRSSVLRGPKLIQIQIFYLQIHFYKTIIKNLVVTLKNAYLIKRAAGGQC